MGGGDINFSLVLALFTSAIAAEKQYNLKRDKPKDASLNGAHGVGQLRVLQTLHRLGGE